MIYILIHFSFQNAQGHVLNIPMPGHTIFSKEATTKDILHLQSLIESHDAIFLLTDSREARWLPSVLGAAYGKVSHCVYQHTYI